MISSTSSSGFNFEVNTTYTLKNVEKKYYVIEGNSEVTLLKSPEYNEVSKLDMKGNLNMDMLINRKTGWTQNATSNLYVKGIIYLVTDNIFSNETETKKVPMIMNMKISLSN
jgi:hypothetical protein